MCGGGGDSAPVNTYQGPPGPGTGIAGVPIGVGNYQDAARSLLSVGQTYGQLAAQAANNVSQSMLVAAPPAPQSAFQGGIGQYLAAGGASPAPGMSPEAMDIQALEAGYDPRTSATEMLEGYESALEPRPLSYYTPNAMENVNFEQPAEEEAVRTGGGGSPSGGGGGGGGGGFGGGRPASVGPPLSAISISGGGSPSGGGGGDGGFGDGIGFGGLY